MRKIPKITNINGRENFRIIASHYPPVNFFEDLVDPLEMETLWEIENLTNERLRDEAGDIFLVPAEDRVSGGGSTVVMAAFTHISVDNPTRFSNGSYGVYYAALEYETAIYETVYRREKFLKSTNEPACELQMRAYRGKIRKELHDIRDKQYKNLHNEEYFESQKFSIQLREMKSWGLIYSSVRHAGGICVAIFRPPAISNPEQYSHLRFIWNGKKITEVYAANTIVKF